MTKEKDTSSERRGSLKMESSSVKTGNVRVATTKTATTTSKNNWFMSKQHHAFKYISLTSTARLSDLKRPNATLYGGHEHTRAKFSLIFLKLD